MNRSFNGARRTKALQPISSFPVPPHPDSQLDTDTVEDEKPTKTYNAFSFLMSRNLENEAWKEATEAENSKWGKMNKGKVKGKVKKEEIEEIEEMGEDGPLEMKVKGEKGVDSGARRPAPFYKVMQGMPIAVDAFRYGKIPGVTAYLLTWVSQSRGQTNILPSKLQSRSL